MTNDAYDGGDNEEKMTQRDKMTDVQNRQKQHRKRQNTLHSCRETRYNRKEKDGIERKT